MKVDFMLGFKAHSKFATVRGKTAFIRFLDILHPWIWLAFDLIPKHLFEISDSFFQVL